MVKKRDPKKRSPASTPEQRENRVVALAVDLAEKQMLEGTATSQVITHFLKIGSTKERLEREYLNEKKELMKAKVEAIKSQKRVEELYEEALKAMRTYSGQDKDDDYDT